MKWHHIGAVILTVFGTLGCASLDLRTAYALSKLKPVDVSPKDGRVAIIFPEGFDLRLMPKISYTASYEGDEKHNEDFRLVEDNSLVKFISLPPGKTIEDVSIFRLDSKDMPRAITLQNHMQALETQGYKGWKTHNHVNFDIEWMPPKIYDAYCKGEHKLPTWVWVKTDRDAPFKRLVNQKGIDKFIGGSIKNSCESRSYVEPTPSQIP